MKEKHVQSEWETARRQSALLESGSSHRFYTTIQKTRKTIFKLTYREQHCLTSFLASLNFHLHATRPWATRP
jgi:hypothetical protein